MARPARRWIRSASALGVAAFALSACQQDPSARPVDQTAASSPSPSSEAPARHDCLVDAREVIAPPPERVVASDQGTVGRVRERDLADETTVDLRGVTVLADQDRTSSTYSPRPVNLAEAGGPEGLCVLGPFVRGIHDRGLGWEYLKHDPGQGDHPAIRVGGRGWAVVDGARVENMMNGFRPAADGLVIRNAYLHYIRDDCIENDELKAVRVEDSLFDGCYTALSARPDRGSPLYDDPRASTTTELDHVLIRLLPMPGGHNVFDPGVRTFGHLWKWSEVSGNTIIRDSVIMVDDPSGRLARGLGWPSNVRAEGVTLVWTGRGDYPGELPDEGVTVTTDRTVWEQARADWMLRHGCTSIDRCDVERLVAPAAPEHA